MQFITKRSFKNGKRKRLMQERSMRNKTKRKGTKSMYIEIYNNVHVCLVRLLIL